MADSSEILPIREALTKLDEIKPGAVPEAAWLKLAGLEDATYRMWAIYLFEQVKTASSTSDPDRQKIRDHIRESSKKNAS